MCVDCIKRLLKPKYIRVGSDAHKATLVIFGSKGAGKTSISRIILDKEDIETPTSLETNPFSNDEFECVVFENEWMRVVEVDGIDVSCEEGGYVRFGKLRDLQLRLQNYGVNLLVFVIKKGRITSEMEQNYNVLVNGLCIRQVPVMMVVTHCDYDGSPESWWESGNSEEFKNFGMTFQEVVCGCTAKGGRDLIFDFAQVMNVNYDITTHAICAAVERNMLQKSWAPTGWMEWLHVYKSILYNSFISAEMSGAESVGGSSDYQILDLDN